MALFEKIRGTIETIFQIGLGRSQIKSQSTGEVEFRNAADSAFVVVRGATPLADNDLVTKAYADTLPKPLIVSRQFDGNNALPANTGVRGFLVVSTTGGTASIGDLLFDNGTGAGSMQVLTAVEGRCIAVTDALAGGTVSFDPDSIYIWDADGGSWLKIGDVGSVTGAIREIRYAVTNAATQDSTSQIPANARIVRASLEVTTPYSGGATVQIGRAGSLNLALDTTENDATTANTYAKNQDTAWGGSALVVRTTVGGAPAAGAGVVVVQYTVPNN